MRKECHVSEPSRADTATRLLDAAEALLGRHGFDGVGMRALAEAAQVNLGAATYHFGSKEKLYLETFLRRFRVVAAAQVQALREAEAASGNRPLPVETIVRCMAAPPFRMMHEHPNFSLLLARNLFQPPAFMVEALQREVPPSLEPFVRALGRALPDLPADVLWLRVTFAGGVLHSYCLPAPQGSPSPLPDAVHTRLVFEEAIRFIAAGLAGPVAGRTAPGLRRSGHIRRRHG